MHVEMTLSNLLNPWLLARIMVGLSSFALLAIAAITALPVALRWRGDSASGAQLELQRRAELVAVAVHIGALVCSFGLLLSVLVAERLAGSIRGAMCAYGVLSATHVGLYALGISGVTAFAAVLWSSLHRFDLSLWEPVLTRAKLIVVIPLALFALADLVGVIAFALQLDFDVVASCCSVWLDDAIADGIVPLVAHPGWLGGAGLSGALLAGGYAYGVARQPRASTVIGVSTIAPLALVTGLLAVSAVTAPHVYGSAYHACPFCLLSSQGYGLGWVIYPALFFASVFGASVGVVEIAARYARRRGATDVEQHRRVLQRQLALWSVGGWLLALVTAVAPVIGYIIQSGGVTVFGG